jgi:Zn finger protein HypA/HybF involved in hydrogenase expression
MTTPTGQPQLVPIHIQAQGYRCLRCDHTWIPRRMGAPRTCPGCGSPYWSVPRGVLPHGPRRRGSLPTAPPAAPA